MRRIIELATTRREELIDITQRVADVVNFLRKLAPPGQWLHDAQDDNGDAHIKAGLVGPSETIPVIDGKLGLSRWQGIFFCEFDGPRSDRRIACMVMADRIASPLLLAPNSGLADHFPEALTEASGAVGAAANRARATCR